MRTDCHIHLDRIGPPHRTPPPDLTEVTAYARRERISLFCAIYEQEETLIRFQAAGLPLFPFYWIRTPLSPNVPASAKGLKLHPFTERYTLEVGNILPSLSVARDRGLPVLIHTDDREPGLSRGSLVASIAAQFPDIDFIMAHSGSYAPGIPDQPGKSYVSDEIIRALVSEAIDVASRLANVYLETSILASSVKAKLIASAPLDKLLIGTDYPISKEHYGSVMFQERMLFDAGMSVTDVQTLHENAFRRFSL